jgi:nitroreductase
MAYNPWEIEPKEFPFTGRLEEKIKYALQFAILAPSTHNTQPWCFSVKNDSCVVYLDSSRLLPYADKDKRDAYISIGCFFETLKHASSIFGIYSSEEYNLSENVEDSSSFKKIATVYFEDREILSIDTFGLEAMKKRYNSRGVFSNSTLPEQCTDGIQQVALPDGCRGFFLHDNKDKKFIGNLVSDSIISFQKNNSFRKELVDWLNTNNSDSRGDGFSVIPQPFSHILPFIIKNFNIGKLLAHINKKTITSAPLLCVIGANEDNKLAWFRSGEAVQKILLTAARLDVQHSIFAAPIEDEKTRELLKTTYTDSFYPQLLIALGYSKKLQKHTPRLPIEERLYIE